MARKERELWEGSQILKKDDSIRIKQHRQGRDGMKDGTVNTIRRRIQNWGIQEKTSRVSTENRGMKNQGKLKIN